MITESFSGVEPVLVTLTGDELLGRGALKRIRARRKARIEQRAARKKAERDAKSKAKIAKYEAEEKEARNPTVEEAPEETPDTSEEQSESEETTEVMGMEIKNSNLLVLGIIALGFYLVKSKKLKFLR